ncbi:MAG TPA: tRNA uridine-5-carboxymethylaminomethyl(34) synthesis GTPase MnmE [Bacteroidales bacterium]|nr:tRNA uridine-5-carboxymethylaminomethyl(34) synthesis GTPase MnmE [Bacteroidales bacterium]
MKPITAMSLKHTFNQNDTVCAVSTPAGVGAIALIRISGTKSFGILRKIFVPAQKFSEQPMPVRTLHYGKIVFKDETIDDVLVSIFRAPHSYTGEDMAEINCHGSMYIQKRIMEVLLASGARLASAGEFTLRSFMNGKLDLAQAEAIADLISATSKNAHDLALSQMRGGFSDKIKELRAKLLRFASMIELELDFSEEDVEFADRHELQHLTNEMKNEVQALLDSFSQGNVLKNGIPVAIIGKPNVGKSTLLNALLNEERAIVSEIPGTTRDTIEDTLTIRGVTFRFIDTAGLRKSTNEIEQLGIERTYQKINQAQVILYVIDISQTTVDDIKNDLADFRQHISDNEKKFIVIANKIDQLVKTPVKFRELVELETIFVSAKRKENISQITDSLLRSVNIADVADRAVVSNIRHYEALNRTLLALVNIGNALEEHVSADLLSTDIHAALHFLGEITGEITTEDLLGEIFGKFCIGK